MSYRLSHLGEEAVVAAAAVPQPSTVLVAAQLMGVALVPWVPVMGGAWVGKKMGGSDGAWLGGISGFVLSVAAMTALLKKVGQ